MKNHMAALLATVIPGLGLWMLPERESGPESAGLLWMTMTMPEEDARSAESERALEAAHRRIEEHTAIIQAMCEHRLTLLQAVASFEEIGRGYNYHRFFRGHSNLERLCRQVIHWTALQDPVLACHLELQLGEILPSPDHLEELASVP